MSLKEMLEKNRKKRKNGLVIRPDIGWLGPKPARTKAEKINQIKTEFIDDRALLIVGARASDFAEYPKIEADISVQRLIQYMDTFEKTEDHKGFLVIDGLDNIPESEQEKFVPLLKDRQILSSKLPNEVQILVPVKKIEDISKRIKSLIFPLKVV